MDRISKSRRSANMACIKGKNTKPELIVRSLLHRLGLRFRLHKKDLPGKPDIVLSKWNTVIFVHGCFWHGHIGCKGASIPKTNTEFWVNKIKKNIERDLIAEEKLRLAGWRVLIVWECQIKNNKILSKNISEWFELDMQQGK